MANNKKTKLKSFFNKNTILISAIASSIALTPVMLAFSLTSCTTSGKVSSEEVKGGLTTSQKNIVDKYIDEENVWSINYGKETKEFKNPVELRNFIDNYVINETQHLVSEDINKYTNEMGFIDGITNKLVSDVFSRTDLNKIAKNVYLGANDVAYDDVTKALNSFYQVKNGYYFNNIFFENKSDLRSYVMDVYLPSNPVKYNSIILKGPNGELSVPINLNDENAILRIEQFIDNSARKQLVYRDLDKNSKVVIDGDGSSQVDQIDSNKMDYIHVQSNQGESRYIVDNDIDDAGNLIGPYFYEGVLDIPAFMDKTMWQKRHDISSSVYFESVLDEQIGNFFKNILNDNKVTPTAYGETPELFNSNLVYDTYVDKYTGKETVESLDKAYMQFLAEKSPRIYREVAELNEIFTRGKRANTFFKIPALYSFILQRIVSYNAKQEVLNRTVEYFTNICNLIDETIKVIIGNNQDLLKRSSDNKEFRAADFFQIGKPEYDINTSTEYFLNEFKTWDKLVVAIVTYNKAVSNINMFAGWAPYEVFPTDVLFKNDVISWKAYNENESAYKAIYNTYSQLNYQDMIREMIKTDPNGKDMTVEEYSIALDNTYSEYSKLPYSYFIKKIGLTNTSVHDYNVSLIESEMALFNETGLIIEDGYLIDLYSTNPRYDRLSKFMSLMNEDEDRDAYKAYIGFMLESRSENAFTHLDSTSEPRWEDVVHAVSRVFTTTVGATLTLNFALSSLVNGVSKHSSSAKRNSSNTKPKKNPVHHFFSRVSKIRSKRASARASRMMDDGEPIFGEIGKWKIQPTKDQPIIVVETNPSTGKLEGIAAPKSIKATVHVDKAIKPSRIRGETDITKVGLQDKAVIQMVDPNRTKSINELKLMWEKNGARPKTGSHLDLTSNTTIDSNKVTSKSDGSQSFIKFDADKPLPPPPVPPHGTDTNKPKPPVPPKPQKPALPPKNNAKHIVMPNIEAQVARNGDSSFAEPIYGTVNKPGTGNNGIINKPGTGNENNGSGNTDSGNNGTNKPNKPGTGNGSVLPNDPGITPDPVLGGTSKTEEPKVTRKFKKTYRRDGAGADNSNPNPLTNNTSSNDNLGSTSTRPISGSGDGSNKKRQSKVGANSASNGSNRDSLIMQNTSRIFNTIGGVVSSLGAALMVVDVVLLFIDIFQKNYTTDYYVFKTRDGTEFIWDGGESYSQYLGFQVTQTKGIEGMKMIKPVQVTLPQIQEYYYYEEVKSYDSRTVKLRQIWNMQNNPDSEIGFHFDNAWYLKNDNNFETIEELTKSVIADLGITFDVNNNPNFDNINKKSKYLSSANFSFTNGLVTSKEHSFKTIADNVEDNIRTTKVVQMPNMRNGYAINKSNDNFVYPGRYWDRTKQQVVENLTRSSSEYLVDNSANLLKNRTFDNYDLLTESDFVVENKIESERIASDNIRRSFDNKVSIMSKLVLSSDYNKTSKWSNLSSDIDMKKVYSVDVPGRGTIYFADKEKALHYTYKVLGYSRKTNNYLFDSKSFSSKDEIYDYVYKNNLLNN